MNYGRNVDITVDGQAQVMTITIDLTKNFGPSGSGKTIVVATTGKPQPVGNVMVGLTVFRYPDR